MIRSVTISASGGTAECHRKCHSHLSTTILVEDRLLLARRRLWTSLWLATILSIPLGLSHSVTCHYTVYTSTTGSQSHSLHCSFNLCLTLAQRSLYHRQTLHNDIHTQCSQLKRNRPSDIRTMSQKIITTFIYDNQKRCCRWTHELWTEARKDKSEKWRMVASDKWRNTTIMINN